MDRRGGRITMANSLYDKGREGFLDGSIDYDTDTIKANLINKTKYTYSAAHTFLTSVGSSARIGTATALTSKTVTSGVAGAAATTFTSVTGATANAVILFKDTGSSGTSRLIAYIDQTSTGGSFSVVPTGGNIIVQWSTGANKIFKL
jgi:hypothetical protein